MTLVIAQKTDNGLLSISDTKLTNSDCSTENPYFGVLKSHIISPSISVHFAGNIFWVEKALKRLTDINGSLEEAPFDAALEILLAVNKESTGETDFLLVNAKTNKIAKVADSSCIEDCEKAYIGDSVAYSEFVSCFESSKCKLEENGIDNRFLDFCAICDAFKQLLKNKSLTSIGGLDVTIMQKQDCLFYQQKVSVDMGPMTIRVGPEPTKIPFGNVQSGSFSVNYLSTNAGDWPQVLAIHMHFGNIGILWGVGHHLRPSIIKNCTHEAIVDFSKKTYGVEVSGMKIN